MHTKIPAVDLAVRRKIPPKALDLKSPAGRALLTKTIERVVRTHKDVLLALANR